MRLFRSIEEAAAGFLPSAVTIGNFDGVHLGHRELVRRTRALAEKHHAVPSAITFDPHPTVVVAPDRAPKLLTGIDERVRLLGAAGIEQVLVIPFGPAVAALSPDDFFRTVLMDALKAKAICVGDNFRFGQRQTGDVETLRRLGAAGHVEIDIVDAIHLRGRLVCSSEVRRALARGAVTLAGRLLGRPYALTGNVVSGAGRGSKETVPTLNLEVRSLDNADRAIPADGVYITRTYDAASDRHWNSITNVGFRPTFDGRHLTIETFLLDPFDGNRPERIRLEFLRWVREERKFDSAEALRTQILKDVSRAQAWFRRTVKLNASPGPLGVSTRIGTEQ